MVAIQETMDTYVVLLLQWILCDAVKELVRRRIISNETRLSAYNQAGEIERMVENV